MGIETVLGVAAIAAAGAGAGYGVSKLAGGGDKGGASPTPLPQVPSVDDASAKAQESARRKRAAQTKTIYSSPLGISGEADLARKTLLGQ